MMNIQSEVFSFKIALKTRIMAENLSRQHSQVDKAKQVYLNTLAISTVSSYLNFIGWSTNLEESDSLNPVLQTMMNVADLQIPGYGQVECCLVLPGEDSVTIAPEVWSKRIAYMVVEINESLSHSKILGFVRQVKQRKLPLSELESLAQFPAYLSQQRRQSFPTNTLSQWFSGALKPGWQTIEELFPSTPSLNFRSSRKLVDDRVDRLSSAVDGVKLVKLSGEVECSIALIIKIQPRSDRDFDVSVTVCNELVQDYLPEGLELVILDGVNHPVMIAQANETETIEFCFSGKKGERFSIEMSLDEHIHLESFII